MLLETASAMMTSHEFSGRSSLKKQEMKFPAEGGKFKMEYSIIEINKKDGASNVVRNIFFPNHWLLSQITII